MIYLPSKEKTRKTSIIGIIFSERQTNLKTFHVTAIMKAAVKAQSIARMRLLK